MSVFLRGSIYWCEFVMDGQRVRQSTGERTERKARMGVNPRNPGQKVHIPAATVPKFTAGSSLKQSVRGG